MTETVEGSRKTIADINSVLGTSSGTAIANRITSIEDTANGVKTTVSNMQIGTTNMIIDSLIKENVPISYSHTFDISSEPIKGQDYVFCIYIGENKELRVHKTLKFPSNINLNKKIKLEINKNTISEVIATNIKEEGRQITYGEFEVLSSDDKYIVSSDDKYFVTGGMYVYGIQLEEGSVPSGWSPAPEDIENSISTSILFN